MTTTSLKLAIKEIQRSYPADSRFKQVTVKMMRMINQQETSSTTYYTYDDFRVMVQTCLVDTDLQHGKQLNQQAVLRDRRQTLVQTNQSPASPRKK